MSPSSRNPRLADEIVERLRSMILTGTYPPGSKLPPERELAKTIGVNRASLREALKQLEQLGLVRIRQGDGTRVTNFMETAGIELISHLIPLAATNYPEMIVDVLEFRRILGREVARMAAARATPEDLDKLRAIAARASGTELAPEQVFEVDFEFYVALAQVARNRVISLLINTVRNAVSAYTPMLVHLNVSHGAVSEHHDAMIRAIAKGDPEVAGRVADRYLKSGADHVVELMAAGGLPVKRP